MELHDFIGLFVYFGMEGQLLRLFLSLLLQFLSVLLSKPFLLFHHFHVVIIISPRVLRLFGVLVQLFEILGHFFLLLLLFDSLVFFELLLLLLDDLFIPHMNGLIARFLHYPLRQLIDRRLFLDLSYSR